MKPPAINPRTVPLAERDTKDLHAQMQKHGYKTVAKALKCDFVTLYRLVRPLKEKAKSKTKVFKAAFVHRKTREKLKAYLGKQGVARYKKVAASAV